MPDTAFPENLLSMDRSSPPPRPIVWQLELLRQSKAIPYSSELATRSVVHGPASWASPAASLKWRNWTPPQAMTQNLHSARSPGIHMHPEVWRLLSRVHPAGRIPPFHDVSLCSSPGCVRAFVPNRNIGPGCLWLSTFQTLLQNSENLV